MEIILNENQQKAVDKIKGPLRIIAGPGSGKTRTIVSKINRIIKDGLAYPNEILAITFTNKAANEIRNRVNGDGETYFKNVYTYHGWCYFLLRVEAENLGLNPNFTIIDSSDSGNLVKKIINENEYLIEKKEAISVFDKIANNTISVDELRDSSQKYKRQLLELYEKYKNAKNKNGFFDFNDLVVEVKKSLEENKELADKWKNKYKYIFIDEFQDTNNIQFEIIQNITNKDSNLTVVGDPDQNIYTWRGANIELINNFSKYYPTAETIMLNVNYRSTPQIIKASNSLISNNKNRVNEFRSSPSKPSGKEVGMIWKNSEMDEAWEITRKISSLVGSYGYDYKDIAIIIRSSFKTKPIETALNHYGIGYRVIGAQKFFDRVEVKQTLRFLLFVAKQNDETLLDIINNPPKKFGPKKVEIARHESTLENISIWEWLNKNKDKQNKEIQEWLKTTNTLLKKIQDNGDIPSLLEEYLDDIGYINRFFDDPNRIENIKETLRIFKNFIKKEIEKEKQNPIEEEQTLTNKIVNFINKSLLSSSADKNSTEGEVNIITAHASKGTEFPVVFIYAMNEGHMPSTYSVEEGNIEEERRIVYVAMTRAMDHLFISTSNGYADYGNYAKEITNSRFVDELLSINRYNYNNKKKQHTTHINKKLAKKDSKIGTKIFHNKFGIGIIKGKNDEFIIVEFESGEEHEILLGHQSYRIIE